MATTELMVLSAWPVQTFYLHNVLRKVLKNGKKKNRNKYKLKKGPPSGGALIMTKLRQLRLSIRLMRRLLKMKRPKLILHE